ncbi:MAG: hypothetical protein ACT4OU_00405 [Hyphomicrobium sp.]
MARGAGLLKHARLTRKQLISFALLSAALNGIITASVGAWLGQTYAKYQARRQSIESLVHLIYERRTRAGMVVSSLRRGADVDEVKFRKRAYDEAYVEWNKNVMQNIFAIREVTGEHMLSSLEGHFENDLVAALADIDRCVTKAYDARIADQDPKPILEQCRMPERHQFALDCGATFTNELYKLSKLTFVPFLRDKKEGKAVSERRIAEACKQPDAKPEIPLQPSPPTTAPAAATAPVVAPQDASTPASPPPAAAAP